MELLNCPFPISKWGCCFERRKRQEAGAGSSAAWQTEQVAASFPQEDALGPAFGEPPPRWPPLPCWVSSHAWAAQLRTLGWRGGSLAHSSCCGLVQLPSPPGPLGCLIIKTNSFSSIDLWSFCVPGTVLDVGVNESDRNPWSSGKAKR